MLTTEVILAIYDTGNTRRFLEGTRYNTTTDARITHRNSLVNIDGGYNTLVSRLTGYVSAYREIRTFDIFRTDIAAVLNLYVQTAGFTRD
jgi:hypothetical protein